MFSKLPIDIQLNVAKMCLGDKFYHYGFHDDFKIQSPYIIDKLAFINTISHVNQEFLILRDRCCDDFGKGIKPKFPFSDFFFGSWMDVNKMTYLQLLSSYRSYPDEFKIELRNSIRARLQKKINKLRSIYSLSEQSQQPLDLLEPVMSFFNSIRDLSGSLPVKKIELFLLSLISLSQCRSKLQFCTTILLSASALIDKSLTELVQENVATMVGELWELYTKDIHSEGQLNEQTDTDLRSMLHNWDRFNDSPFVKKIREFVSYCMSFGVIEYFGLSASSAELIYNEFKVVKKPRQISSFIYSILDVIEFVFSRMAVCIESRSLGPLLHTADAYGLWFDDCAKIDEWNRMLSHAIEVRPFSVQEFHALLESCIARGEEYVKYATSNKERRELNALVGKMRVILGDFLTTELVGKARQMPFSILLSGDSSIGKSTIMKILFVVFGKAFNKPMDEDYFYNRNFADDFWSGFKSYKWCIALDDIGAMLPEKCPTGDKSMSEVFIICNPVPVTANMADLNDKGKQAIRPDLVIGTTNAPTLNAEKMFTLPSAARRRFPFRITPFVKPEYRKSPEKNALDANKVPSLAPNQFPDLWTFKVEEIKPVPLRDSSGAVNRGADEEIIYENASLEEFLLWYVKAAKTHRSNQTMIAQQVDNYKNATFCEHFLPINNCSQCSMNEQSLADVLALAMFVLTSMGLCTALWKKESILALYEELKNNKESLTQLIEAHRPIAQKAIAINDTIDNCVENIIITRDRITNIGRKVLRTALSKQVLVPVAILLAGVCSAKLMISTLYEQFKFVKPQPKDEKEAAKWVNEIPNFNKLNFLPQVVSTKARSKEEVLFQFSKNVVNVTLSVPNTEIRINTNAVFIGGMNMIINTHALRNLPNSFVAEFVFYSKATQIGKNTKIVIHKNSIIKEYYDVTILKIGNFGIFPTLNKYFPKDIPAGRFNGTLIHRNKEGNIEYIPVKNLDCALRQNYSKGVIRDYMLAKGYVDNNTVDGHCGSLLVVDTPIGYSIFGIHSLGGSNNIAGSSMLTQEILSDLQFIEVGKFDLGERQEEQMNVEPVTLDFSLRPKDPFNFRESGLGEVYGSLGTGPSKMKSAVESTVIRDFFEKKGFHTDNIAPVFNNKLWHKGLDAMMKDELLVSNAEAEFVAQSVARDFYNKMSYEEKELIEFYDPETAVLGADGINYVNCMDMRTSLGFPIKKPKTTVFKQVGNKWQLPEEVKIEMDRIRGLLEQGIRSNAICSASAKDEARDAAKVDIGKIRIFMGSYTPFNGVMKQFYGSLIRVIQRNPLDFETAVGINAHSVQWDKLAHKLIDFSSLLIDGDHSEFDKLMESIVIYEAFCGYNWLIIQCMLDTGKITQDDVPKISLLLNTIACDVAFAFIDYNGTLVSFLRNHVSGQVLTVIINSFVNSMYMRMAYRRIAGDDPNMEKFHDRILMVSYGDDFILSVKDYSEFNFTSLQQSLASFGVKITPADKNAESYIYTDITKVDFLKRKFVFSEELGRYVGALSEKSISKSLLIGLRSKSVTKEEQAVSIMNSALREYFFHGKEKYNWFRDLVFEAKDECNLRFYFKDAWFMPYEVLLQEYQGKDIVHIFQNVSEEEEHLQLDEQCDFKDRIRLNAERIRMGIPIERTYDPSDVFCLSHRIKRKLRKLKCMLQCRLNSDMYICWLCQVQSDNQLIDSFDTVSFNRVELNLNRSFNNNLSLSPARNGESTTPIENGEVCRDQCDHYLLQDNAILHLNEQMDMQETLLFSDANKGDSVDIATYTDPSREDGAITSGDFSSYLKRPVLIHSYTWAEGTHFSNSIKPWALWAQQSQIQDKLNNFGLFRGTLKIKVVINASPFFYGAARASYAPLLGLMYNENIVKDSQRKWLVPFSQRKGFYIYPQDNQGGEMTLPFFWHKNWLNNTQLEDFQNMGTLEIASFVPLDNANSVTSANVTIQVFAWCENVELSAPTLRLAAQSEYSDMGPVSGPASAVAKAASALASIPSIAPFALATEMVASKVGKVARIFGYTNVPNTEAERPVHPSAFHGMASTNISTPYEVLGLDDKNQLSVDPRIVGLEPVDELELSHILSRESWIYTTTWTASAAAGSHLFNTYVIPDLVRVDSSTRQSTPLCHFGKLFLNWRGSIVFKIRIIASKFHRGRIRISYDPNADLSLTTSADPITTSFTKIVDISEVSEIEMEIPWMQARSYKQTMSGYPDLTEWMNSGGALPALPFSSDIFTNGTLNISVFTVQTSPVSSADVQIMVFAKAGKDFEYANPTDAPLNYTYLKEQADVQSDEPDKKESIILAPTERHAEDLNLIHFGESFKSLRQLFRRKNYYLTLVCKQGNDGNSAGLTVNNWTFPRYPQPFGYVTNNYGAFNYVPGNLTPTATFAANEVTNSALSHTAMCFVGARGSIVYTINTNAPLAIADVQLGRTGSFSDSFDVNLKGWSNPRTVSTFAPSSLGSFTKLRKTRQINGNAGRVITNQLTQAGISALFPYYSPNRFTSATNYVTYSNATEVSKPVEERSDVVQITVTTKPNLAQNNNIELSTSLDLYYMAGPDFTLHYFNNVPSLYRYTLPYSVQP